MRFKIVRLTSIRNGPKRTIYVNGGFGLLQLLKIDEVSCWIIKKEIAVIDTIFIRMSHFRETKSKTTRAYTGSGHHHIPLLRFVVPTDISF